MRHSILSLKRNPGLTVAGVLVLGLGLFTGPLVAQAGQAAPGQAVQNDFSPAKIRAAAEAYLVVLEIQEKFKPQIEGAQDAQQAQSLQQAANEEMVEAIEEQDNIDVNEYSQIVTAAQQDEQFRQQFVSTVQQVQQEKAEEAQGLAPMQP
jgi:hypothetical protein